MNQQINHGPRPRFSLRQMLWWFVGFSILFAVIGWASFVVREARRNAQRVANLGRFSQLDVALRNYHAHKGHFPPAYIADASGKPMHSWRVLLLPYLECRHLYDAYDFNEPWDGPNNSKLINQMPDVYQAETEKRTGVFTCFVLITGQGTAFPGSGTTSLADITDGPENTILATEITQSNVPWTEPRDIDIDRDGLGVNVPGKLSISAVGWREPLVIVAEKHVPFEIDRTMPINTLRGLVTIDGGEEVTRDAAIEEGHLR